MPKTPSSAIDWKPEDAQAVQSLYQRLRRISQQIENSNEDDFQNQWKQKLKNCEAVSFDIFDTALARTCLKPDHVFFFLKDVEPFASLPLRMEQIHLRRIRAEQDAREKLWQSSQSVETTLAEIYASFGSAVDNPASASAFAEAEKKVETLLAIPNQPVFKLWEQARLNGKKILFLSDTYFDKAFLHQLLTQCGYEVSPEQIFASCEHREGKYTGKLFHIACQAHSINPSRLLHIGDNASSDVEGAQKAGAQGLLHPYTFDTEGKIRAGSYANQKTESLLQGITQITEPPAGDDFWFRLGYQAFGSLFTGFSLWLRKQFQKDGIQTVCFMLRDGWILKQVFDIIAPHHAIQTRFLPSSRRAFGMASLGCQNTLDGEFLIISANPRPAKEFLTRLDIDAQKVLPAFGDAGFSSPDEIVHHKDKPGKVLALLRHPLVLAVLNQRALVERKLLLKYFEQENLFHNKTALVDIGWNASNQKFLSTVLKHESVAAETTGYYLGTFPRAQDAELNHAYQSYLCHNGEPYRMMNAIAECREFFEIICTNFEGSLRHFTKADGKIIPVLDPVEISEEQQHKIREVHRGILAFARAFAEHPLARSIDVLEPELASANLLAVLEKPSFDEAEHIGGLEHGDGLGSLTQKHLAVFSGETPQELLEDYANAYWPKGLIAGDSVQAFFLRNILYSVSQ